MTKRRLRRMLDLVRGGMEPKRALNRGELHRLLRRALAGDSEAVAELAQLRAAEKKFVAQRHPKRRSKFVAKRREQQWHAAVRAVSKGQPVAGAILDWIERQGGRAPEHWVAKKSPANPDPLMCRWPAFRSEVRAHLEGREKLDLPPVHLLDKAADELVNVAASTFALWSRVQALRCCVEGFAPPGHCPGGTKGR